MTRELLSVHEICDRIQAEDREELGDLSLWIAIHLHSYLTVVNDAIETLLPGEITEWIVLTNLAKAINLLNVNKLSGRVCDLNEMVCLTVMDLYRRTRLSARFVVVLRNILGGLNIHQGHLRAYSDMPVQVIALAKPFPAN